MNHSEIKWLRMIRSPVILKNLQRRRRQKNDLIIAAASSLDDKCAYAPLVIYEAIRCVLRE